MPIPKVESSPELSAVLSNCQAAVIFGLLSMGLPVLRIGTISSVEFRLHVPLPTALQKAKGLLLNESCAALVAALRLAAKRPSEKLCTALGRLLSETYRY